MKEKKPKFILDIVPLTKIPLTRDQSFCYLSEKKLPAGTLVSITLFKRKIEGIVIGSRDDFERFGNIELKKIEEIIEEKFLNEHQIKLARYISDYYISPLGIVMKNFVPKRTKARHIKLTAYTIKQKIINLTKEQQLAIGNILQSYSKLKIKNSPPKADQPMAEKFLLFGPSASGKTEIYIHSILELTKKDKDFQFLILLPEKTLTLQAIERYGAHFKPEEIAVLSSNISKGQFYSNWQNVKTGKVKIIIGTRMAVFAPFKKLGLIVIDEEQDMSYKQWDMNPRYDGRKVAEKLSELHNCQIIFGSATPSIETYYKTTNNQFKLLRLPILNIQDTQYQMPDAITVDMRKERINKNRSCISKKLRSEIAYAIKNKLQTILFINRQGMSNFSVCQSCKTVLKCPKCERALVYDKDGTYRCIHCAYKTSIIPSCPKCKEIIFKNVGLGTQKVEREIIHLFPGIRVARIDSQAIKKSFFQAKIYEDFSSGKIDILIGTQMISKGWDLPNVSLIGIIDADNILALPDFSATSRFFQNIVQISGRVSRPGAKFPGVIILQTYQPENKLIKLAQKRDWKNFFEIETAERKSLNLPPFAKLIKLVFQDYSIKKVATEINRTYNLLKSIKNINISEPENCYVSNIRGRFRKQIIIKQKKEISPELRKILKGLGQGWIIDIDPISII